MSRKEIIIWSDEVIHTQMIASNASTFPCQFAPNQVRTHSLQLDRQREAKSVHRLYLCKVEAASFSLLAISGSKYENT